MKDKLLLHICCGICASQIIKRLQENYEVIGYFYNPNIEPPIEYQQRLIATEKLLTHCKVKLIYGANDNLNWHSAILGLEHWQEGGPRCWRCFRIRLEATAEYAQKESIRYYATTLTASPYKNAAIINSLGKKIGKKYHITFIETNYQQEEKDFQLSKKLDLYRQKYCGCLYSARFE
ncbi:MAG: epoxyqueuosine reductase QueH [candidate division WOR-3 bacterium]|nr:epoxyqueuosine reductase QueH [candidate division WOR-3 bacterium]